MKVKHPGFPYKEKEHKLYCKNCAISVTCPVLNVCQNGIKIIFKRSYNGNLLSLQRHRLIKTEMILLVMVRFMTLMLVLFLVRKQLLSL